MAIVPFPISYPPHPTSICLCGDVPGISQHVPGCQGTKVRELAHVALLDFQRGTAGGQDCAVGTFPHAYLKIMWVFLKP